jgi:hypothetical protein
VIKMKKYEALSKFAGEDEMTHALANDYRRN